MSSNSCIKKEKQKSTLNYQCEFFISFCFCSTFMILNFRNCFKGIFSNWKIIQNFMFDIIRDNLNNFLDSEKLSKISR